MDIIHNTISPKPGRVIPFALGNRTIITTLRQEATNIPAIRSYEIIA